MTPEEAKDLVPGDLVVCTTGSYTGGGFKSGVVYTVGGCYYKEGDNRVSVEKDENNNPNGWVYANFDLIAHKSKTPQKYVVLKWRGDLNRFITSALGFGNTVEECNKVIEDNIKHTSEVNSLKHENDKQGNLIPSYHIMKNIIKMEVEEIK